MNGSISDKSVVKDELKLCKLTKAVCSNGKTVPDVDQYLANVNSSAFDAD